MSNDPVAPVYRYRVAEVVDVHDGDTFTARIDLGFRASVEVELRIRGIDAPELSDHPSGPDAAAWAKGVLTEATDLVVETYKGPRSGKDVRTFARWVADVYVHGDSYADLAVDAGHAKRI